jgi:hypothetical protein
MATLFERLGRSAPSETAQKPEPEPAQLLLTWLQKWTRPTITARQIRIYGPTRTRKPEVAIAAAEKLVRQGWLTPIKELQRNRRRWGIVRRPLVHPVVENVAAE